MRFTLGTYNLRMEHLDTGRINGWPTRKPRLMESLRSAGFDAAGLQEINSRMQDDLLQELGEEYGFWFFSPYSQNGEGDKAHGIMYRKTLFDIGEKRSFWISDDPDTSAVADVGANGNYRRGGCCAVLTHKPSGIRVFLMCTHACYNKKPNARFAPLYRRMEERFNPERLPSFFVGDMNATPDSEASRTFREYWLDAYDVASPSTRSGPENTYNAYKYPAGISRIDYIYFRSASVAMESYSCDPSLHSGGYPSDHFPVSAVIRIDPDL